MAITVSNSNYGGEVLEQILTKITTGNELVDRGLIRMEPGVKKDFSIPRIKTGTMLQKRKEQPTDSDGKGDFTYDEVKLSPKEFMAFTTFNPRSFSTVWRKWQPKGNLVFSQLPAEAQNILLSELAKACNFEVGDQLINGEYAETGDTKLFDGFVKRMSSSSDKIVVTTTETTMIGKLKAVRNAIPKNLRSQPGLRILMSVGDSDLYDEELSAQANKGTNWTDTNAQRFKGITIEALAQWPDNLIVATVTGMGLDTNLWAGCNLQDDIDVIQIDKLTNAGEKYFFKVLMKMDTQIAWGDYVVWLDKRA